MTSVNDFNRQIIEEFRANDGKVGGPFEGMDVLILHTTGAKSGAERATPLVFERSGDGFVIFASKAGADTNPAWYHNLVAHPEASVEVGSGTVAVTARVAGPGEREEIWEPWKAKTPQFAQYEANTSRTIPVVILERHA